MADSSNTVVFEFTTQGTTVITDDINVISKSLNTINQQTGQVSTGFAGLNNAAGLFGKAGQDATESILKSQAKVLNGGAALAKNIASLVTQTYKDETKALEDKFNTEKTLIESTAQTQIQTLKDTTDMTLTASDLTARQKIIIKAKEASEAAAIDAKAKADELKAQTTLDAQKKKLAQQAADINFAITAAQIISSTASAVMKDFADPTLLPPFDAIAAAISAGIGIVQLDAANVQRQNVQSLGSGGIVQGPKHTQGGVSFNVGGNKTELEGGEGVINATAMAVPGVANIVSALNTHSTAANFDNIKIQPTSTLSKSVIIDKDRDNRPIKTYVLEKEITMTQQKVSAIQSRATIG